VSRFLLRAFLTGWGSFIHWMDISILTGRLSGVNFYLLDRIYLLLLAGGVIDIRFFKVRVSGSALESGFFSTGWGSFGLSRLALSLLK